MYSTRSRIRWFAAIATLPALQLKLTGGDNRGVPGGTNATDGLLVLERTLGPGALAPNQIVVDTGSPGGALAPDVRAAEVVPAGLARQPQRGFQGRRRRVFQQFRAQPPARRKDVVCGHCS